MTNAPRPRPSPRWPISAERLEKANGELKAATMWFMAERHGQSEQCRRGRASLHAHHGHRRAGADVAADGDRPRRPRWTRARDNAAFYETKLVTARYFGERFTPDAGALRRKIEAGSEAMMALGRRCSR
jgi:hypothetical protein